MVVDDGGPMFAAATNGAWIKFGREWCEKACDDNDKLFGLMLHERMHILFMHMFRRDGRDMGLWNEANDAIINRNIKDMGYSLPEGGVDIPWVRADMSSEEVYDRLKKEQPPPPPKGGGGQGDGPKGGWDNQGDLEDAPDQGAQGDLEATIRAAAQMARDCGDKSAMVDRILGTPAKATVNWKDEVRAALTSSSRDDFTYRRFSRRFVGRGLYLPSLHSDSLGGLLIGFDTSGSMSEEDCQQVAGEIQGIIDDLSPDWVEVVYCDSKIKATQRFVKGDQLELKPKGGGGTAFKPVFDYADKLQTEGGERIAAMIYLTDMEGPMGDLVEPEFPVVWGCVYARPSAAPFGAVVQVVV
jgi:predicted metal-dependent peptidase